MVGESEQKPEDSGAALEDKILALESEFTGEELNLDVRQSVGLLRQIWVLFRKRYQLLKRTSGLIVYGVNLLLPIIVAAALTKYLYTWKALVTCEESYDTYRYPVGLDIPPLESTGVASLFGSQILGPQGQFSSPIQDALYADIMWVFPIQITEDKC